MNEWIRCSMDLPMLLFSLFRIFPVPGSLPFTQLVGDKLRHDGHSKTATMKHFMSVLESGCRADD